jgi:drug/metabolite transporter (DMT)-like permease
MRAFRISSSLPIVVLIGGLLGSTLVATRFSLGQFETQTYVALRLFVAGLIFLAGYALRLHTWPRSPGLWLRAGIYGLIGTAVTMSAFTQSLRYQSSGVTSLLVTLSPVETALLAHFFLRNERITRTRMLGALIAFCGVGLLLARGESGLAQMAQADWRGYAWAMLGVLSNSIGLVYARRWLKSEDAYVVTSIRILVGALIIGLLTVFTSGIHLEHMRLSGALAVLYAGGAGTFLAFLFYLTAVQRHGATAASQAEYIVPLFAAGLGVIALGEKVTPVMLLGMLVIFIGLAVFNRNVD